MVESTRDLFFEQYFVCILKVVGNQSGAGRHVTTGISRIASNNRFPIPPNVVGTTPSPTAARGASACRSRLVKVHSATIFTKSDPSSDSKQSLESLRR